jgi:type IV secretion system protein VirB6
MEDMPPLIGPLFTSAETSLAQFYANGVVPIAAAMRTLFTVLLMIYITIWGLAHWRGLIQDPFWDFVMRVLKIALLIGIGLNTAVYLPQVAHRVFALPNEIVALLEPALPAIANGPATAIGALDQIWQLGLRAADRFLEHAVSMPWRSIGAIVVTLGFALALVVTVLVLVALGTAVMLIAKVTLALLLVLGPIFIVLLLFEATRSLFSGWLGQLLTAMVTFVLAGAIVYLGAFLCLSHLQTALDQTPVGSAPSLPQFLSFVLLAISAAYLLRQVPALASGIAGGIQITTLGLAGDAWRMTARALDRAARPPARRNPPSNALLRMENLPADRRLGGARPRPS